MSGSYLTGAPGIITVTGTADFEISVDNNTFLNSLSIPYSSPDLVNTTIYVRLKAGLPAGSYNNELITHAGGGAVSVAVTCSGSISLAPLAPVALSATQVTSNSFTANWNASAAAAGYQLDVATDNGFLNFVPGFNNLYVNNVTTYPVNGLAVKTPYFYRVRAYNNNAESENSNIISLNTLQDNTGFNFDESAASDAYTFQKTLFVNIKDNARGENIHLYCWRKTRLFNTGCAGYQQVLPQRTRRVCN
ncbi:MAG: fibronectin type III domain-containing protein [Bacteroidales bacterium]